MPMPRMVMSEAQAPFLPVRIVADMDMLAAGRAGVVGRIAAGPALEVRVDATGIALKINGATDRMV